MLSPNKMYFRSPALFLIIAALVGLPLAHAQAANKDRGLTVMTRNMDEATDFGPIFAAQTFPEFATQVAAAYGEVQQSKIAERAAAIAREIEATQPQLVGLQEVSIWRTGPFGGPATVVTYDALQSLLDELNNRGLHYTPIAVLAEFDAEAPSALGINIRFTDYDVVLARTDLKTSGLKLANIQAQHFATNLVFTSPVLGTLTIPRGWIAVDGKIRGKEFRFVTAHLESFSPLVQIAQADELTQGPCNTELPVLLAGDFNSDAESSDPIQNTAYFHLRAAGLADVWPATHPGEHGFTWPLHGEDPYTSASTPTQRIDLVLYRGGVDLRGAALIGHTTADLTLSGLWPSDHAGVRASFTLEP